MANNFSQKPNSEMLIYQAEDGTTKISVRFENENLWLTQQQMADLFQSSRTNVVEHIKHIYEEVELQEITTCRKFRQVQIEGNREVSRELPFYNLDLIISLGYRNAIIKEGTDLFKLKQEYDKNPTIALKRKRS